MLRFGIYYSCKQGMNPPHFVSKSPDEERQAPTDPRPPLSTNTTAFLRSPIIAMVFAAVQRSFSRCALPRSRQLGRQHDLSTTFRAPSGSRKSAVGIEAHDWDPRPPSLKTDPTCVVNSHTEWDPLEEVIVGRIEDATVPEWHVSGKAVWPKKHWDMYKQEAGKPFPKWLVKEGER